MTFTIALFLLVEFVEKIFRKIQSIIKFFLDKYSSIVFPNYVTIFSQYIANYEYDVVQRVELEQLTHL